MDTQLTLFTAPVLWGILTIRWFSFLFKSRAKYQNHFSTVWNINKCCHYVVRDPTGQCVPHPRFEERHPPIIQTALTPALWHPCYRPGVQMKSEMKSFLIFIVLFCSNSSKTEIQDIHIKNLIVPLHPKEWQTVKVYKYKLIFSGWWECGSDLWLRACRGGGLQCQMVQRGSGDIQVMLKFDIFQITNCFTGVNLDLFPAPLPLSRCFPYLVSELTSPGLMKESSPWKRSQCSHLDTICAR